MSIYNAVICSLIALNACMLWGRAYMKPTSPVSFEPLQTMHLAFWLAREYGPQALKPKPTKREKAALALDQVLGLNATDE
jgi:hypothetical protein